MNNYHADSTAGLWIHIAIGAEHLAL